MRRKKRRNHGLIATVAAGYPVTFSSIWEPTSGGTWLHAHPRIVDNNNKVGAWVPQTLNGEWIQVNFMRPSIVRAIETAGRKSAKYP